MLEDTPARLLTAAGRAIYVSFGGRESPCARPDVAERVRHGLGVVPTVDHRRTLALNRVHAVLSQVGHATARATDSLRSIAEVCCRIPGRLHSSDCQNSAGGRCGPDDSSCTPRRGADSSRASPSHRVEVATCWAQHRRRHDFPQSKVLGHLACSMDTARNYTQPVIEKLGAHAKPDIVIIAMREGLECST